MFLQFFSIFAKCQSQKGVKKKFEKFYCFFLLTVEWLNSKKINIFFQKKLFGPTDLSGFFLTATFPHLPEMDQNQHFSVSVSVCLSIIDYRRSEVRGVQGVKSGPIRFFGKIRIWPKMAQNGPDLRALRNFRFFFCELSHSKQEKAIKFFEFFFRSFLTDT